MRCLGVGAMKTGSGWEGGGGGGAGGGVETHQANGVADVMLSIEEWISRS